jgi:hypothetical protein
MSYEAWPSPDARRGPLPRIDDLPIAEQGYDQEAVREAFDAFYRHAAQLDASLKALEAVEAFRRDAMELRNDLRSLRGLGYGAPEPDWARSWTVGRAPRELSPAVPRLAAEAALLIGIAVVAGVAGFRPWLVVALMGAALAIVLLVEWLAARARTRLPATVYAAELLEEPQASEVGGEPAPFVEAAAPDPGVGWSAFAPAEDAADEQAAAHEHAAADDLPDDTQEGPLAVEAAASEAPAEQEELEEREEQPEPEEPAEPEPVAVGADDREPWELGFDGDGPVEAGSRGPLTRLLRRRR